MKKVLKNIPGKSLLIMENTAGGGNKIGSDLKEIGEIFRNVNSKRVKVCIDTAHAFEVGNIDEYTPKKIKNFFDEFERVIGLKNLECLHINDSKTQAGSQHDRHENIGKGFIGIQGFKSLAYEKRLMKIPWLLEVPGFDNQGPDKKNIQIVRKLFS
ncbi:MAG: hypothetical protein COU27_02755 [Candidatus Levybacteria bacterium CG10_big_fil_rev_8_21_14_0_10_36_7]|nr:MAG: hypothetical protein COU27_02755 [Candidatus Levybacteria bacterium CG10_big_fil_rev_8_21_14_0_10_36_7]